MGALKCLLFDYGGTLDSPAEHWSEVIRRAWRAEGVDFDPEDFYPIYVKAEKTLAHPGEVAPSDTFLDLMRKKISIENSYAAIQVPDTVCLRVAQRCYDYARANIAANRPILVKLSRRLPLGIVSNFYGNLRAVLADMEILNIFAAVADSGLLPWRKPDPRIWLEGLHMTGSGITPGETLVTGDRMDKDILPALSAGFRTAWLKGPSESSENTDNAMSSASAGMAGSPDYTLRSLAELPDIVQNLL